MTEQPPPDSDADSAKENGRNKFIRSTVNAASGFIPFAGGLISAAMGHWSETEQERAMNALRSWIKMLEDELREKQKTILEIIARLDMHDEEIAQRVQSKEYQSLLKKAFRQWAGTESQTKQEYIRNILSNAAATKIVDDDVIKLFIDWLATYSEFHFAVIGEIYRRPGSTRGNIWRALGKGAVREDSAEADLFKLLVRDLSTGGIIRQHRETDYAGNYIRKQPSRGGSSSNVMKSAFDDSEQYELTSIGQQFVHYAMTDLPTKITYQPADDDFTDS